MENISKLLCCFNSLATNSIQILIIILSLIGIIINIIGMFVIPWGYTSKLMEIFYLISLVLFGYSLFIPILILCMRKKIFNENIIFCCFSNCFIGICVCVLSLFLNIFIFIATIPDFKNRKKVDEEISQGEKIQTTKKNEQNLVSKGELSFTIFSLVISIILWAILLILWVSVIIRLKYKIEGTYKDYLNEQRHISNSSNDITKSSELNVIGHDKYGYPIYNNIKEKPKRDYNYGLSYDKYSYNNKNNKNEIETNNIFRYSYKEKFTEKNNRKPECKSVEIIQNIKKEEKEKYIEKYYEGAPIPYSNYKNITVLNLSTINNSINPGY